MWATHCAKLSKSKRGLQALELLKQANGGEVDPNSGFPVMPDIDARKMFWNMMRLSRTPDPNVFPALQKLKASGKFIIAALSNTIPFPAGVKDENGVLFESGSAMVHSQFDVFVSSAHLGMRKPEKRIFDYTLEEVRKVARQRGMGDVEFSDVCFLDDIGTNLKAARALGIKTIRVPLGKSEVAVKELEEVVNMSLLGDSTGSKL
jgi:FMN phosphatase YigB (HAD superfamily)